MERVFLGGIILNLFYEWVFYVIYLKDYVWVNIVEVVGKLGIMEFYRRFWCMEVIKSLICGKEDLVKKSIFYIIVNSFERIFLMIVGVKGRKLGVLFLRFLLSYLISFYL